MISRRYPNPTAKEGQCGRVEEFGSRCEMKMYQGYFLKLYKSSLFWWGQSHGHLSSTFSEVKKEPAPPSRRAEKRVPHESILVWKDWGGDKIGRMKGKKCCFFLLIEYYNISFVDVIVLIVIFWTVWKMMKISQRSLGSVVLVQWYQVWWSFKNQDPLLFCSCIWVHEIIISPNVEGLVKGIDC